MRRMIPGSRPKMTEAKVWELLAPYNIDRQKFPIVIVGIRGYYEDTMGVPGKNDRGVYDDAIFVTAPGLWVAFNGNTDPSVSRPGIAVLKPGIYYSYRFDMHRGAVSKYPAICQRVAPVTVIRDGGKEESGMFGINIHKGGVNTTSSEGCQTIPVEQWVSFYETAKAIAVKMWGAEWNKRTIPYVLIDLSPTLS